MQTNKNSLLWIIATGFFMQTLDSTIVNTALPSIARSFGEDPLRMHTVVVAYTLTMAMLTPASGWLADRYGIRATYVTSIALFMLGSVLCAQADTLDGLVVARAVQGAGGSMLMPVGRLTLLRTSARPGDYIAAVATVSISGQLGPLLGPTLGGWLVQSSDWRSIFLINVPIGAVGLLAAHRFLPAGRQPDMPPFDLRGCLLLSLCMVAFSLATDMPAREHPRLFAAGLFALSLVAACLYAHHARKTHAPVFKLGLFRERNFSVGLVGNLLSRTGSGAIPFVLPLMFQLEMGLSPVQSGLMMVPTALAGILAKPWISRLVDRYGYERFLLVNTALLGASIVSFAIIDADLPWTLQVAPLLVFGAANSMQFSAMNSVTLKGLRPADAGSGNCLFSMVQMLALGLGASVGSGLVNLLTGHLGSSRDAFDYSFAAFGLVTLLAGLVFRQLDEPRQPSPMRS